MLCGRTLGDGRGGGHTPEFVASRPPSHLPAASCSHSTPPPSPCASAPSPPAQMPTCWLAVRAAAVAGTCGWTSLRRGGENGQGYPESQSSEPGSPQSRCLTPGTPAAVMPAPRPLPWAARGCFHGPPQSCPVPTSCPSLEERSISSLGLITSSLPRSCHSPAV